MRTGRYSMGATADSFEIGEYRGSKSILSKHDNDLFHEEDKIESNVFSVKRTSSRTRGERWKLLVNDETILTIEGNKVSKKGRAFLRSINGFKFLIDCAKNRVRSMNAFRKHLKSKMV